MLRSAYPCTRLWVGTALTRGFKRLPSKATCAYCGADTARKKLVFLGTPQVAANVLAKLFDASNNTDSTFEIAGVVSQPGRPKGRGSRSKPQPSPVESLALERGLEQDKILCPVKPNESFLFFITAASSSRYTRPHMVELFAPDFLAALRDLEPDLCLTAAYGNILPKSFLEIPRHGTLNIHPSLLPKYRGAAPVQRALQDGNSETGVSIAFTVRAMDAGPIVEQRKIVIDPSIQAPELLEQLFDTGTDLLLDCLPQVWSGAAAKDAKQQDDSQMTHAAKLSKEEGVLDFREDALTLHNKIRAFAGWPGTTAKFQIATIGGEPSEEVLKITRARSLSEAPEQSESRPSVDVGKHHLRISCGNQASDGVLEILEVQPVGKKVMAIRAFLNGLQNKQISL